MSSAVEYVRMSNEHRRAERYPLLLRVDLRVVAENDSTEPGPAVVSSISRSGIFVATPMRVAIGQPIFFRFPGPFGECLALGNVIENRGELGFAVEFQGETEETKRFFEHLERLDPDRSWSLLQSLDGASLEVV
jgi:hypothetical protein